MRSPARSLLVAALLPLLCATCSAVPPPPPAPSQRGIEIWVDPVAGSDANSGATAAAPLRTLPRAQQEARRQRSLLKQQHHQGSDGNDSAITVLLGTGLYELPGGLTSRRRDCHFADALSPSLSKQPPKAEGEGSRTISLADG